MGRRRSNGCCRRSETEPDILTKMHVFRTIKFMSRDTDLRDAGSIAMTMDDALIIRSVDRSWDLRADSFGADACFGRALVGTSLLLHIAGQTPRAFFRQLYARVGQLGTTIHLPYRCDAPDRIRHMEMQVDRLDDGFRCTHRTLFTEAARPERMRYAFVTKSTRTTIPWCSQCMAVQWNGTWTSVAQAAMEGFQVTTAICPVYCTLCPNCLGSLDRLVGHAATPSASAIDSAVHNHQHRLPELSQLDS